MKKFNYLLKTGSIFLVFAMLFFIGCQNDNELLEVQQLDESVIFESDPIEGQYIIVLNELAKNSSRESYSKVSKSLKDEFSTKFSKINLKSENIDKTFGYSIKGFSAKLTENQLLSIRSDKRVKSIEQDYMITISPFKGKPGGGGGDPVVEETPYGITRVGGGNVASTNTAWVIDSGIDLTHPDLNVDVARSVSFVRGDANDQNGHGTHVAGTIAAIDNEIGVVGVAPGNIVVAVRVLDRRGSGSISGVISGIDYVAANGSNGDVANMSLGGGISSTLDNAVIAAAATGVKFALAAGNESDDADNHSPARAEGVNIYTVSAMDVNDNFASFSNYGSHVDYCAPGVGTTSTWKNGGYNTISGTSMATPHVAGLLLLGSITTDGFVNNDPDGNPDPIAHN